MNKYTTLDYTQYTLNSYSIYCSIYINNLSGSVECIKQALFTHPVYIITAAG